MKKSTSMIIGGLLILVIGGVVIAGYFTDWFGLYNPPEIQTLSIKGSTTVEPIALATAAAYMEDHPNVDIQVSGGGSSAGVTGAADGVVEIGMASRGVKNSEFIAHPELIEWPICADGIAVIVHPNNPITQLTGDQIRGIFNGTITEWSNATAFGGDAWSSGGTITVVNRDSASGTREFFSGWLGLDFVETAVEVDSNGAVHTTVSTSQYAIGYVGLGYVDSAIVALEVDDGSGFIAPSVTTVQDGSYAISRNLYFLTKGFPIELAADFISFVMSTEGKALVADEGFVPFPDLAGTIDIKGSTTVEPIALAAALWFEMMNPGITVTISGGGSSAGVTAVSDGTVDIGMASRALKSSEIVANPLLNQTAIAKDGIAVIVHPNNPITQLTGDQIRGIFNGTITEWSNATAFGGDAWSSGGTITVVNRDSASGTREFFSGWLGLDFVETAVEVDSNGAVHTTVSTSQYAIGYVGLGYVDSAVVALEIDDGAGFVSPSEATVQDLSYPIARDLYMITVNALDEQNALVKAFFNFLIEQRVGQYIVKDEDFVPLPLGYIL